MAQGRLSQDEGLEQVRWLVECGQVDFVEISGGNAEDKTSGLHSKKFSSNHQILLTAFVLGSFGTNSIHKAPQRAEPTRIREAYFTEFAEKVQHLDSKVPIQLSGGWSSDLSFLQVESSSDL